MAYINCLILYLTYEFNKFLLDFKTFIVPLSTIKSSLYCTVKLQKKSYTYNLFH